MVQAHKCVKQI